jgi:uncharacterized membrane protein YfcA
VFVGLACGLFPGFIFGLIGAGSGIVAILLLSHMSDISIHFILPLALLLTFIAALYTASKNLGSVYIQKSGLIVIVLSAVFMAPVGVYSTKFISSEILKTIFNIFVICAAVSMWPRKYNRGTLTHLTGRNYFELALTGVFAGVMNALLGVSGGVIVVPSLNAIGFHINKCIVTSSCVVLFTTTVSLISYFITRADIVEFFYDKYVMVIYLVIGCIIGSFVGNRLSKILPEAILKKIFAIFIGCVAGATIVKTILYL